MAIKSCGVLLYLCYNLVMWVLYLIWLSGSNLREIRVEYPTSKQCEQAAEAFKELAHSAWCERASVQQIGFESHESEE